MIIDWLSEDTKELKQAIGITSDSEKQVSRTGTGIKSNLASNSKSGSRSHIAPSSANAYRSSIRSSSPSSSDSNKN